MRHTPGPWIHTVAGPNHWIKTEEGRTIAFIGGPDTIFARHKGTPHKENAHAIAAVPELLAALKAMGLAFVLHPGDPKTRLHAITLANNAIANAT